MLLSFERPVPAGSALAPTRPAQRLLGRPLKTAQQPQPPRPISRGGETGITDRALELGQDHRQDSKGTWWMPWHLESMKGVDDCDKPR
jgi:hypothetical protein